MHTAGRPVLMKLVSVLQELEAIKARVREMEEEAEKLKELQNEVEKQMNLSPPPGPSRHLSTYPISNLSLLSIPQKEEYHDVGIDGFCAYVSTLRHNKYYHPCFLPGALDTLEYCIISVNLDPLSFLP